MTMQTLPRVNASRDISCRVESGRSPTANREAGQSLVEVALIMSVLIVMLSGLVDLGRWIYVGMEVSSAARAGAQYGSTNRITAADTAGITQAATNDSGVSGLSLTPAPSTFCRCSNAAGTNVSCSTSSCTAGALVLYLEVDTQASYTPFITYAILGSRTLKGKSIMPVGQ